MMLCNEKIECIELKDFIIKPVSFIISNREFHGITDEIAQTQGILFADILDTLSILFRNNITYYSA